MSGGGRGKRSSKGGEGTPRKKRASQDATAVTSQGPIPDDKGFALVYYTSDKTKGVVEIKSIVKKDRIVGNKCKAPYPLDMILEQKKNNNQQAKFDAYIVQFGSKL